VTEEKSHRRIVEALIAAGANVNLPDGAAVMPLQHVQRRGCTAIATPLQDAGARRCAKRFKSPALRS
jgi:hypothetical protein